MIKRFVERMLQTCWSNRIENARATFRHAFELDPDFRHGYVANIAMLFHDRYGRGNYITNREKRNQAAEAVLDLIFKKEG